MSYRQRVSFFISCNTRTVQQDIFKVEDTANLFLCQVKKVFLFFVCLNLILKTNLLPIFIVDSSQYRC